MIFWRKDWDRLSYLVVALLSTIGIGLILLHNWKLREQSHADQQQAILDTAYRASIQSYRVAMESFYATVLNTPPVLTLFAQAGNGGEAERSLARGRLYRLLYKPYLAMQKLNLLQLHFHLADGTSFLRFHQPDRFGDQLFEARPGVRICNTEKRIVQGMESGRLRSGYRYIFPLALDGRHLGSVEVSVTVKSILENLKQLDPGREYAYVINRKLAEKILFPEQRWLYNPAVINGEYLVEDARAVLPDSPPPLSDEAAELNRLLGRRPDIGEAMRLGRPLTVSETLRSMPYTVSLLPMHDVSGQLSGYLITYTRDTIIKKLRQEYLLLLFFAAAALLVIQVLLWRLRARTKALDRAKQNLEATTNAMAEGVYVQNLNGVITMVNAATCQLLGYDEEELLGQEAHSLFHRNERLQRTAQQTCPFYNEIRNGQPYNGEEIFETSRGRMLTVEVASRPIFQNGRVIGSVTAFHDITERKQTEAALRLSEEKGRNLLTAVEQSPISVVITDADGIIEYVNEKFVHQSGFTREEALGSNPRIMKSGLVPAEVYQDLWATIVAGQEWRGELQNRHKNGSLYSESVTISPVRSETGEITHFIALKEDITARMQMEKDLRDSEMVQRTLMESMPVGLIIIDEETRLIEQVNPFAAELFQAEPERIVGHICHHFLCPAERDSCPICDLGQSVDNSDRVMITADGTHIPVLKTVRKVRIHDRTKLMECFVDIRERKRAEDDLLNANRQLERAIDRAEQMARQAEAANLAKGAFLANMSHEIRTPMNAVLGMIHLALRTGLTPQQQDFLHKAETAAKSLLGILNDILDFSKIEAGMLDFERIEFDIHGVLDNLITVISPRLQDKDVELVITVASDVPARLVGDPLRLGQILINLAGNAAKFTEHGEVRIALALEKPVQPGQAVLRIEVHDTGIGISAEQLDKLFVPFTQLDISISRQYGGTGLGLSISRRLAAMTGGGLEVASTPGSGSCFTLTAPFELPAVQPAPVPAPAELAGRRILVVEDHPAAAETLRRYLHDLGMRCDIAATSPEALTLLGENSGQDPTALLLIDLDLPDGGSGSVIRAAAADTGFGNGIPAVCMVKNLHGGEREATEHAACTVVVQKPLTRNTLLSVIASTLSRGETATHLQRDTAHTAAVDTATQQGKILLVEDNAINRLVAQNFLEENGYHVTTAADGMQALEQAAAQRFDLVLMDIQMPGMDGFETARQLRLMPGLEGLPIIALTAYATHDAGERIVAAGMDDHLTKPIDFDELAGAIHRHIARPGQASEAAAPVARVPVADPDGIAACLEELIAALRTNRPRPCGEALLRLKEMGWPAGRQGMENIEQLVALYDFEPALNIATSMMAALNETGEKQ